MIDLLLMMVMITTMFILVVSNFKVVSMNPLLFIYSYLDKQSEAMEKQIKIEFYPDDSVYHNSLIQFNSKGHVNHAQTVSILNNSRWTDIVIELGSGRLVIKE